jgi:hypothetical protein
MELKKTEQQEQMIAEYKQNYRRVTGETCPTIKVEKAWIKVGEISFRPKDFEQALAVLKTRLPIERKGEATNVIEDFDSIQSILSTLNDLEKKALSLNTVPAEEMDKVSEHIEFLRKKFNDTQLRHCIIK